MSFPSGVYSSITAGCAIVVAVVLVAVPLLAAAVDDVAVFAVYSPAGCAAVAVDYSDSSYAA